MYDILQVTAEYSNAVLVAVLPFVSDFAKKLDLPIPTPIEASQVSSFKCSWRSDEIGGSIHLASGYQFTFLDGRVGLYRSPQSYYSLQDPKRVADFYGDVQIGEPQVVQIARDAVRKLGYSEATLGTDKNPVVRPPPRSGSHTIPRYRIKWLQASKGGSGDPTVEMEVNAANGRIEMVTLYSRATFRPQPAVSVKAPIARPGPRTEPAGQGRKIYPVTETYSNAFLLAILPQFGEYAQKAGFPVRLPVTMGDLDSANCVCGLIEGDPYASVNLRDGSRFVYSHGQVIAYYAADVMYLPGRPNTLQGDLRFVGPINMTTNEGVALVRRTLRSLGYSEKALHVDEPPMPFGPGRYGIARYVLNWMESIEGPFWVVAEVDAKTKTLKSLYVNDHALTNIWRSPPKIDVPMEPPISDSQIETPPSSVDRRGPPPATPP